MTGNKETPEHELVATTLVDADQPSTAERLAAVMAGMTAVGKDRRADSSMGGYSFRGIEDVANAVHPLLSHHGLTLVAESIQSPTGRPGRARSAGTACCT